MNDVLVADGVSKAYGDVRALDDVSLSVSEGEVFGLIGPNGAGKTTLVRALTGTVSVEGRVTVLGSPPGAVEAERVGLLPQSYSPAARLTPRELLEYYAGLYDEARDPGAVLADVGLTDCAGEWYETLSGGQKRRACVGAALVNDPDVLFLDEPTTGIDPAGRRAVWRLLDELAAGGTTVFLTSHSMGEIERLADRVGLLRDGSLVAVGSPTELVTHHGGAPRVVVEAEPDVTVDEGALGDELGHRVESADREVVVHDVGPADIGDVVAALDRHGVAYESLAWSQPSLEDVYLSLTGNAFEGSAGRSTPAVGAARRAGPSPRAVDGSAEAGGDHQ